MILRSLSLQNFRGITSETICFAARGVTLVSGPNEVGKTSFLLALDMLLSDPDSSSKASVKAVQQVGRDVGPEASVTLRTGDYELTLSKRWIKSPSTTLEITLPSRETLRGREAHDRVREILAETLDEALWKALRYHQGALHDSYAPTQSQTLGSALDLAAGSSNTSQSGAASDLIALVREERSRYVTETGKPTKTRAASVTILQGLKEQIEEVERALTQIEDKSSELLQLRQMLQGHTLELSEHQGKLAEYEIQWSEFQDLSTALRMAKLESTIAHQSHEAARKAQQDRTDSAEAVEGSITELAELELSRGDLIAKLASAVADSEEAERTLKRDSSALDDVVAREQYVLSELEVISQQQEVERLQGALAQVDQLRSSQEESEAFLVRCSITPEIVTGLETLEQAVSTTQAQLNFELPKVTVTAHGRFILSQRDGAVSLEIGDSHPLPQGDPTEFSIADLATITVTGGSNRSELRSELEDALRKLAEYRREHGLSESDDATSAQQILMDRELHLERLDRVTQFLNQILESFGYSSLSEMRTRLTILLSQLPPGAEQTEFERHDQLSLDELRGKRDELTRLRLAAERSLQRSRDALQGAQHSAAEYHGKLSVVEERHRHTSTRSQALKDKLAHSRDHLSDERLESELDTAFQRLCSCEQACKVLEERVQAPHLRLLEEQRESESLRIAELEEEQDRLEQRIAGLMGELSALGESGYHSKLEKLRGEYYGLEAQITTVDRKARAAEKLYQTLLHYQLEDRKRLLDPLTSAICTLGSVIYGEHFEVQLDHDSLRITTRTIKGITLSFDQLSVGAQEQLTLIYLLAVARITGASADDDESMPGAPLILDDALGNSDRNRLYQLGSLFRMVSPTTQIIVFTCFPDRFSSVGGARRIQLPTGSS
jgi:hypothetical protein